MMHGLLVFTGHVFWLVELITLVCMSSVVQFFATLDMYNGNGWEFHCMQEAPKSKLPEE